MLANHWKNEHPNRCWIALSTTESIIFGMPRPTCQHFFNRTFVTELRNIYIDPVGQLRVNLIVRKCGRDGTLQEVCSLFMFCSVALNNVWGVRSHSWLFSWEKVAWFAPVFLSGCMACGHLETSQYAGTTANMLDVNQVSRRKRSWFCSH